MKKLLLILLIPFILISCGQEEVVETEKKDYIIEVKKISDFDSSYIIEKTGKISSSQSISLTSKVKGEIGQMLVKAGDTVKKGQILIKVNDTENYQGNLNAASIGIETAQVNYDTQKIALDKAVSDTEIDLKRTRKNFEISKSQIEQDMKRIKINYENADLSVIDSNSTLQLDKLKDSIKKAELDYDNLLLQNKQQVNTFISNAKNEYNSISLLYTDIIEYSDRILSVTEKNKDTNYEFKNVLGATDSMSLENSKKQLYELITYKEKLEKLSTDSISEENILEFLGEFHEGYTLLNNFLNTFETMIIASVDSQLFNKNTNLTSVNTYQTQVQGGKTSFLATKNAISSFLNTYKQTEASSKKQIELMYKDNDITEKSLQDGNKLGEIEYKKSILALEDQLSALETGLEKMEINYNNVQKNREVTLKNLEIQIKNARNTYSTALKEYQKLTITSPINGVVGDVLAQKGEEINLGTNLLYLSNTNAGEIEVFLTKQELIYIKEGQSVSVEIDAQEVGGNIFSISKIANANLNYGAKISINEPLSIVGNVVDVNIPVVLDKLLLPVNIIETIGGDNAQIKTLSGNKIENSVIELGAIWGNSVEIETDLPKDLNIITSETKNYDEAKFKLIIKQAEGETK